MYGKVGTSEPSKNSGVKGPRLLKMRSRALHLEGQSVDPLVRFLKEFPSSENSVSSYATLCVPLSTRILFGECTAGSGVGDRESLLLEVASAAANVECSNEVLFLHNQWSPQTSVVGIKWWRKLVRSIDLWEPKFRVT
jgi:hypothetical protein